MNEKVDIPVGFLAEIEAKIQKIVQHSGCTRDEAIERLITTFLERADKAGKKIEPSGFTITVKRILGDASLAKNAAPYFRDAGQ
jgi:hypothetical protein